MPFDAGSVVGRLELGLAAWKKSVETVKADQQSLTGFAMRHSDEIKKVGQAYAIVGGAIVGALTAVLLTSARAGDNFDEMSARTGTSTETLSTLKLAADKSGTSIDSVAQGMKFLSAQMVETAGAGDKSKTVLGAVGVSATDANGKLRPMKDVLFDVADRFAGMESGALKSKLAVAIFGRAGTDLIPILDLGSKGLKENEEAAKRLGLEWSGPASKAAAEFADSLEDLKAANVGFGKTIALSIMPAVKEFADKATNAIVEVREWADKNPDLTRSLTGLAGGLGATSLVGGTLLVTFAKIAASAKSLSLAATMPIIFTVGLIGGAAVGKALEHLRDLYEKKHGTFVDDETKAWARFEMELGGWSNVASAVGYEYQRLNKFSKESQNATEELNSIWQKFGGNSRETLQAIAKGGPGLEKFKDALRNVGGSALDALLGETKLTDATKDLDPATAALRKQLEDLIKSLAGGDTATAALKKSQEEYISFLNSIGIYTHEQQRAKLKEVEKVQGELNARLKAGSIDQEDYQKKNAALNATLIEYGVIVKTALPPSRDLTGFVKALAGVNADAEKETIRLNTVLKDLGGRTMEEVARATREVFKEQYALIALYKAGTLSPIEFAKAMGVLEEKLRSMGGYDIKADAAPKLNAYAQAFANMLTEIVQGWSSAFVKMFGLTDALIGKSTQHIQKYFDGAIDDLTRDYDAATSVYDALFDKISETYQAALEEVNAYYDGLREAADDAYDVERDKLGEVTDARLKKMRREYEDKRDWIEANIKDEKTRNAMLKKLDRDYEDSVDKVKHEEKDKLKALEKKHEDYLKELKAAELEREKQLALDKKAEEEKLKLELKAIEDKYQAELARIRADEETSREEHAASELKRQNSLWTKVKTVFGNAVEGMFTAWMVRLITPTLDSITNKIFPAMDSIGNKGESVGTKTGNALSGIATGIKDICVAVLDVIEDIATTVVDIVAYALETLAESIATAARSLAAAAPDLLLVGAVAIALYAGFTLVKGLVDKIIGGGGGGAGDGMGRVVERQDRFLAIWDWWAPAIADIASFIQGQNDHRADQLDNLAGCINTQGGNIVSAIGKIAKAETGAIVTSPSLVMVGENAPAIPEVILPLPELGAFARGMAAAGASSGAGAYAGGTLNVNVKMKPVLIDKGGKWMIEFIQESFDHRGLTVPVGCIGE